MYKVINFVSIPEKGFGARVETTFPEFDNVRRKINLDLDSLERGRVPFPFRIEVEKVI